MAEINLREYLQVIEGAIEQGRYDEALAHGRHILQHYPKYLPVYRLLGKAMVEAGRDDLAEDMFRRVLSGDLEDFVARVGMSIIADRQGNLQRAIWHMERAFELAPNNEAIQDELRRLYGRRDGVEPARIQLTRAGLARLYLRGSLFSKAIEELRALLADEPERVDLWVALAEACWRNDQRVQAEEACLHVLDELPYCLKANLILGEIWSRSGREEGQIYLDRAEALDPEHEQAVKLLGDRSPFALREVRVPQLEFAPPEVIERPAWMAAGVEAEPGEAERELVDLEAEMGVQIEIPSWLEELGAAEEEGEEGIAPAAEEMPPIGEEMAEVPEWMLEEPIGTEMAETAGEEAPSVEEVPEWLREVGEVEGLEQPPEAPEAEEGIPEWLGEVAPAEAAAEGAPEVPDWLVEEEAAEEVGPAEAPSAEPPIPAEIPDWLKEMAPPEVKEEAEAFAPAPPEEGVGAEESLPVEGEEEIPEWLMEAAAPSAAEGGPEIPEWLEEVAPPPAEPEVPSEPEAAPLEEAGPPVAEEPEVPSWLEGEGLPSGDEALAWLESLAAGKEEELRAAAEAEAEARMAEIMGRPREEAPSPPPAKPEVPSEPEAAVPPTEIGPPIEEAVLEEVGEVEMPDWLVAAAAPEPAPAPEPELPEEAPALEEPIPPEVPRAEVPPAEPEAFGWTRFGAEEPLPEAAPPEPVPTAEESFGWTEFEAEPALPVEEVGVVEGEPEAVAPEIGPAPEVPTEEAAPVAPEAAAVAETPSVEAIPVEEAAPPPPPEKPRPPEVEEKERLPEGVKELQEYVRAHPRDHQARLALARELWRSGLYADSLEAYSRLLRSGKRVEEVMADIEAHLQERPSDPAVRRVLGDAYMRAGRLAEALEVYREALESM